MYYGALGGEKLQRMLSKARNTSDQDKAKMINKEVIFLGAPFVLSQNNMYNIASFIVLLSSDGQQKCVM